MDETSDALYDVEKGEMSAATFNPCAEGIRCDGDEVWYTGNRDVRVERERLLSALRALRDNDIDSLTLGDVTAEKHTGARLRLKFGRSSRSCILTDELRPDGSMERGVIEFLELFE